MIKNTYVWLLFELIVFSKMAYSQVIEENVKKDTVIKAASRIYPLPIFYYYPSTGYSFGTALLHYSKPNTTNQDQFPDLYYCYFTYSTKKHIQTSIKITKTIGNDDFKYEVEGSYFYTPQQFWGISSDSDFGVCENVTYNQYRLKINFIASIFKHCYIGPFFWYEKFTLSNYDPNGIIAKGNLLGALGITNVGGGIKLNYDGRDSLLFTNKGIFVDLKELFFSKAIGSDVNFQWFAFDFRYYYGLNNGHVLAFNTVLNSTTGNVPFQMLPLLGNQQIMRGIPPDKYTDKNLLALQVEYRFPIIWHLGAAVFGGLGQVFPKYSQFTFNDFKTAGGFGLRYTVDKDQHLNARFDIARSLEGTYVFFTFTEAF